MDTVSFVPPAEVGSYALSGNGRKIAYSAVAPDRTSILMIADLDRRVVDAVAYPVRLDPFSWIQHDQVLSVIVTHLDRMLRGGSVTMGTSRGVVDTTERLLATESGDGSMRCLELMSFDGVSQPLLLVHGGGARDTVMLDASGEFCRFSPDGRFVSWNRGGGSDIFAASTERSRLRGRVSIAQVGNEARWSADSRTIYHRATGAWYSIAAPGSDLKPVGKPHLLFKGNFLQAAASWDRACDGRFLLLAGQPLEHVNRLRVITNFGKCLTERMAQTTSR